MLPSPTPSFTTPLEHLVLLARRVTLPPLRVRDVVKPSSINIISTKPFFRLNAFVHAIMSDFTPEVTAMGNEIKEATKDESRPSFLNEEAAALAREKGWAERLEYDYSVYNSTEKPGEGSEAPWAAGAAKYEWSDEYGDVGPPNPELEQMLFQGEFAGRAGVKFDQ